MHHSAYPIKYLRTSALSLYPTVVVCIALRPSAVMTHYGFSYYGNLRATLLPFCVGLVTAAYYLWRAAKVLAAEPVYQLYRLADGLKLMALSILGIVVTPSLSVMPPIRLAHVVFGTAIFAAASILSMRYLVWVRCGALDWMLLTCQMLSVLMAFMSFEFLDAFKLMLPAQLMAATAFSLLLLRTVGYSSVWHQQFAGVLRVMMIVHGRQGAGQRL